MLLILKKMRNKIKNILREELFKEVIEADERCTNTVLASMGVCHDEPIMNIGRLRSIISAELNVGDTVVYSGTKSDERKKDVFFLYPVEGDNELLSSMEDGELKDVYPHSYKKGATDNPPGLPFQYDTGIIKIRTVNNLISKIKNEGPIGSYLVTVRDHVLVVHKVNDGNTYVVDTEGKFRSKAVVRQMVYIERDPSNALFKWMNDKSKRSKDMVLTV